MSSAPGNQDNIKEVSALLATLKNDLADKAARGESQRKALERLKVLGRQPQDAEAIFTKDGIRTLAEYGLAGDADEASREALRCLANALFLNPASRQTFADLGQASAAVHRLRSGGFEDEFLCCRILFLLTYDTRLDFDDLIKEDELGDVVCERLRGHVLSSGDATTQGSRTMAMTDLLKLLFNVTHFCPSLVTRFDSAVGPIFELLRTESARVVLPMDQPVTSLVNSLLNLDIRSNDGTPESKINVTAKNVENLVVILDQSVSTYAESELDASLSPLISLLRKVLGQASPPISALLKKRLLPTDAERERPLGRSETIFARLVRLSTDPMTPNLRDPVSRLLFELSDSDAETFVRNVGFGYASGFMANNGIAAPSTLQGEASTGGSADAAIRDINPVTGQYTDREVHDDGPPMTDEEKEREAERLFVLFERLKATGVVDVQNPFEAMRGKRFEEVPDN